MNLESIKKTGLDNVEVLDSLNAPLLELRVGLNASTTIPTENELKIFSDDNANDSTNRQTISYKLQKPLQFLNDTSDEFVLEPVFKGNKVQMNTYVIRKVAPTISKESILVGEDLSGVKLSLTLVRLMLFSETNMLESTNYKIVDKTDTEEDGREIETISLRTSDNILVDILFQYDGTHHVLLKNTEEYVLPDDFGTVTYTYETRFENLDNYMKKVIEGGLEILETPVIEQLAYRPIVLFSSYNKISTNYQNAILNLTYPKNVDFIKYFLTSSFSYNLNNEDKFLTLDDIYFKDCFTEIDEQNINAEFNKLTIK